MHTAESDSAVWCIPRSLTQLCDAHRGVWLCSEKNTAESDSVVWCTPRSRLSSGMHTAEFFEKFWSLDSVVGCIPWSLTPRYDAHRRVMHTVEWCTPQGFLKIRISWRNQNRIRKYFNLFIRALDGFESWKKWRSKISWHTPFKKTAKIDGRKMPILKFKYLVNGWRDNADFLICYKL